MELNNQIYKEKSTSWFKRIALTVLVLVLILVSFGLGLYLSEKNNLVKELAKKEVAFLGSVTGKYSSAPNGELSQDVDFKLFWDVWDTIKRDYVDKGKINEKEMFYGAIKGMVSSVDDPYTVFMNPITAQEFENDLAGTFEGIGAEIGIRDDILTVIAPLEDMPAQKAGLKAGDKIYAIDKESTMGITIDEAVRKIRGPKDSIVTLTVSSEGIEAAKDVQVTRGVIVIKSVKTEMRKDGIFVVKISNFNTDTSDLFNDAVRQISETNPKGIIIDMRNNPGGFLDTAIEVSSEWVEEGPIVFEKFSEENKNEYLARGRARLNGIPTVVLVNQGSASASEIVAGALRDYKLATLVGMKTFGKGSVQSLREFSDGSSVKITVAKWLTPNGDTINNEGIKPDVEVDLTLEDFKADKDPQMDKAIEILLSGDKK